METVRGLLGREHPNIGRKPRIQRLQQLIGSDRTGESEARNLSKGMNAGISAAGAGDSHALSFNRGERCFQLFLDRPRVGLPLESGEVGAVVRNSQLESTHLRRA